MSKAQRIITGLAGLLAATLFAACSGAGGSIATVNGQPISQSDFEAKLETSPVARNILQQMVQEALIDQYAKNNNITVTDAEIAAREDQLKANFPNGSWDEMLKSRNLTEADVKNALREQIVLDKALAKQVTITPAQVKQYFDKNHAAFDKPEQVQARHILVADLATANKIEAQLKSGANFADLAKQYSTDPGSKDKGGDLGCFGHNQMVKPFDQAAFSLPVGKISDPVKSPFGYHIIRVNEKKPAQKATLAGSEAQIRSTLAQQAQQQQIPAFLQELRAKATITVADPRFAELANTPLPPPPNTAAPAPVTPAPAATK